MTTWAHKLDVSDVFHDPALSITDKRDAIVRRVRSCRWAKGDDDLDSIVDEMAGVESVEDFDCVWSAFYDWCDGERVWVTTR